MPKQLELSFTEGPPPEELWRRLPEEHRLEAVRCLTELLVRAARRHEPALASRAALDVDSEPCAPAPVPKTEKM